MRRIALTAFTERPRQQSRSLTPPNAGANRSSSDRLWCASCYDHAARINQPEESFMTETTAATDVPNVDVPNVDVPNVDVPNVEERKQLLEGVVTSLLDELKKGTGDKDRRRQVEEWMRTLAEKYPEFRVEVGLRDYYAAEAKRLRADFDKCSELSEKLALGRQVESFLDRASEYERRIADRQ
jgi:hypothetical protein